MEELLEQLIMEAISLDATDLHFKSQNEQVIYVRAKNELKPFKKLTLTSYQRLMAYLEYKAQLDFNRLAYPQTGAFKLLIQQQTYYFRLSYLPSNHDVHLVLRILNKKKKIKFNDLTHDDKILDYFKNLLLKESGLVVLCGPTGSGKSTTLHCFLEKINELRAKNIVTIEDPVEIFIPNTIQIQVNEHIGLTFEKILEQVLRHDPDVIMIGELRNEYTASIALKLSLTGHLVLTTLHSSNGTSAIKRLENLGLKKDDLFQVLISIVSQRLLYKKDDLSPFLIFEILNKDNIDALLSQKDTYYETLIDAINLFYQEGWVSDDDYQKFS